MAAEAEAAREARAKVSSTIVIYSIERTFPNLCLIFFKRIVKKRGQKVIFWRKLYNQD